MSLRFKTERLYVDITEDVTEIPSDQLMPLLNDEVTRYLPDGWQLSANLNDDIKRIYRKLEVGKVLTIRLRENNSLIGLGFLFDFDPAASTNDVKLGYLFGQDYWGQGLASEMLIGLMQVLESYGTVRQVLAVVDQNNKASAKVLTKRGYTLLSEAQGLETYRFSFFSY